MRLLPILRRRQERNLAVKAIDQALAKSRLLLQQSIESHPIVFGLLGICTNPVPLGSRQKSFAKLGYPKAKSSLTLKIIVSIAPPYRSGCGQTIGRGTSPRHGGRCREVSALLNASPSGAAPSREATGRRKTRGLAGGEPLLDLVLHRGPDGSSLKSGGQKYGRSFM